MTTGLNPSHYGPLFIPVILERLPNSIKLIVTQKLGKNNWHVSDFINSIKEEVDARENCDFIKDKTDYKHLRNMTHSLFGVQKYSRKNCVIDISIRNKILRKEKGCKIAERATNVTVAVQSCMEWIPIKKKNHHTSICENTINIDHENIVKVKNLLLTIMKKMKRKCLC